MLDDNDNDRTTTSDQEPVLPTTATGVPALGSRDQSWRYFSTASGSVTTTSSGSAARSSSSAASETPMRLMQPRTVERSPRPGAGTGALAAPRPCPDTGR